jgi:hypothetical protein
MAVRVDDDKKYKFWHMVVLCAATALAVLFVFVSSVDRTGYVKCLLRPHRLKNPPRRMK